MCPRAVSDRAASRAASPEPITTTSASPAGELEKCWDIRLSVRRMVTFGSVEGGERESWSATPFPFTPHARLEPGQQDGSSSRHVQGSLLNRLHLRRGELPHPAISSPWLTLSAGLHHGDAPGRNRPH